LAIETAGQSGGLISYKKKIMRVVYRKPWQAVNSGYSRFLNLANEFINNIHITEVNEDITGVLLRPLK
jgi:hypothetical protein